MEQLSVRLNRPDVPAARRVRCRARSDRTRLVRPLLSHLRVTLIRVRSSEPARAGNHRVPLLVRGGRLGPGAHAEAAPPRLDPRSRSASPSARSGRPAPLLCRWRRHAAGARGLMDQLRALARDGVLPPSSCWFGEDAMRELVPEERVRAVREEEMPRLPLSYFEASVPLPSGWNARPCAYLLLSGEPCGESAAEARDSGWPVIELPGLGHLATRRRSRSPSRTRCLTLRARLSDRARARHSS
jgi:hypothetical protein